MPRRANRLTLSLLVIFVRCWVQAHQDVREKLKVAQRRQKDAFDEGVKYTVYQPGDLVLPRTEAW